MLDRATITGADDSTNIDELIGISKEYAHFVEWGILVSRSQTGSCRFPSLAWIMELWNALKTHDEIRVSVHVCGQWVRDICDGNWTPLFSNVGPLLDSAQRVQLNFHAYEHLLSPRFFGEAEFRSNEKGWQLIFQCDGCNDHLVSNAYEDGVNAVPLYDKSGGAGVLPGEWPRAMAGIYSGYAGGLSPENLGQELPKIAAAAGDDRYWIDTETRVRSDDDSRLDMQKVRSFLTTALHFANTELSTPPH